MSASTAKIACRCALKENDNLRFVSITQVFPQVAKKCLYGPVDPPFETSESRGVTHQLGDFGMILQVGDAQNTWT